MEATIGRMLTSDISADSFVDANGAVDSAAYNAEVNKVTAKAKNVAAELAAAIDVYIRSAQVNVTVPPMAIITAGSPTAQAGPPAPLPLVGGLT